MLSYVDSAAGASHQSLDQPHYSPRMLISTELNEQLVEGIFVGLTKVPTLEKSCRN